MNDSFSNAIELAIQSNESLDSLVTIVRAYKQTGLPQSEAYSSLERIRRKTAPDKIDLVLDLMDVVSGFCVPNRRIWEGAISD